MANTNRKTDPLAHTVKDIQGKDVDLSSYKGQVVLFVNVASECGFTPQYEGLEKLWQRYRDKGVVVLGFPANDFGAQEPGSDTEIQQFCEARFGVTFPLFSKIAVTGQERSPVFEALSAAAGEPKWNFHKYLVDRKGNVVRGYPSAVEPLSNELTADIDAALEA